MQFRLQCHAVFQGETKLSTFSIIQEVHLITQVDFNSQTNLRGQNVFQQKTDNRRILTTHLGYILHDN